MKSTLFLGAIACIMGVALAGDSADKVEHVNAVVEDYIRERMIDLPMMRSAVDHFACYDDLTRKINNITDEANDKSEQCIKTANDAKASTLQELKEARVAMSAQVSRVQNSFFECARKSIGLDYFECLKEAVTADSEIMQAIAKTSQGLIDQHADGLKVIQYKENTCLADAINVAKSKSDIGFTVLRQCLGQGLTYDEV